MWNAYVVTILCLYAPSHKFRSPRGNQMLENLLVNSDTTADPGPADTPGNAGTGGESIQLVPSKGLSFFTKTAQEWNVTSDDRFNLLPLFMVPPLPYLLCDNLWNLLTSFACISIWRQMFFLSTSIYLSYLAPVILVFFSLLSTL